MKKAIGLIAFSILFTFLFSFHKPLPPSPATSSQIHTIIIDAGHGGKDPGAHGAYSKEKDICLAIALKLGKTLKAKYPHLKIIQTRTKDTYPEIRERADFANRNNGDLFISIHANAAANHSIYGTETYIWAADRSDEKEEFIADRIEGDGGKDEYQPDINSPEFRARSLIWTKKFFTKSLLLASYVEQEFKKAGRLSRGVKQRNHKGIWVLQATAMPSILVETGFVSSRKEEKYLSSDKGRQEVAACIARAVGNYIKATEK